MKTWEMIKELTENPSKKFMCKSGPRKGRTVGFDGRSIDWHDEYRTNEFEKSYFSIKSTLNWEWEEVKEPVDFMTVIAEVKHAQRRLPITLIYEKYEAKYRNEYLSNVLNYLRMNFESNKIAEIIQNGKWYIED